MLFTKVSNKIHEDMVLLYLTLCSMFNNERPEWVIDISSISSRLHIIVIIIIVSLHVGYLGKDLFCIYLGLSYVSSLSWVRECRSFIRVHFSWTLCVVPRSNKCVAWPPMHLVRCSREFKLCFTPFALCARFFRIIRFLLSLFALCVFGSWRRKLYVCKQNLVDIEVFPSSFEQIHFSLVY